jgi:hypothetical protein
MQISYRGLISRICQKQYTEIIHSRVKLEKITLENVGIATFSRVLAEDTRYGSSAPLQ